MLEVSPQEYKRIVETNRIVREQKFKETALAIHKKISRIEYLTNQVNNSSPHCSIDDNIISCELVNKMIDGEIIEVINLNKQLLKYI